MRDLSPISLLNFQRSKNQWAKYTTIKYVVDSAETAPSIYTIKLVGAESETGPAQYIDYRLERERKGFTMKIDVILMLEWDLPIWNNNIKPNHILWV